MTVNRVTAIRAGEEIINKQFKKLIITGIYIKILRCCQIYYAIQNLEFFHLHTAYCTDLFIINLLLLLLLLLLFVIVSIPR